MSEKKSKKKKDVREHIQKIETNLREIRQLRGQIKQLSPHVKFFIDRWTVRLVQGYWKAHCTVDGELYQLHLAPRDEFSLRDFQRRVLEENRRLGFKLENSNEL